MNIMHANRPLVAAPRLLLLALAASFALSGCAPGMADLQAWVAEVKARPPKPLDPLPVMQQFETFEYAAQAMRDPFSGPLAENEGGADSGLRPDPTRRKEPLEAYPLDSMSMVGSFVKAGTSFALLRVDNLLYQVKVGDYLGQNYGRITKIGETDLALREVVQDAAGEWTERISSLQLQEKAR